MYISKLQMNPGPLVFEYLNDHGQRGLYSDHQLLWSLFPADRETKRDFLFRKEIKYGYPLYYVVSKRQPVSHDSFFRIETKEYRPQLKKGQRFSFTLRVNPVIAKKVEGVKNSKHHDIWMNAKKEGEHRGFQSVELKTFMENQAKKWLVDRSEALGFSITLNELIVDGYTQHRFYKFKDKKSITIGTLDFSGIATVSHVENMLHTLYFGIRKSKAFGCGLMLIRLI